VEIGLGLAPRFTLGRGAGKRVLRLLFERRFGTELARRAKQGFGVPVEKWLRGPLAPVAEELFSKKRIMRYGLLSTALAGGGWRVHANRDPQMLWHAFALATWCEAELGEGPDRVREIFGLFAPRAPSPGGAANAVYQQ
jgi:asparagine synthase (glutamine-hydrolysing)